MTQVDFAIITIRQDEFDAVLKRFPTTRYTGASKRTYGISQVTTKTGKSCKVAVARASEQGNDVAQQLAHDIISDLDPLILLVVGIAGGVPSDDFTLGDVIISTRIDNLNVSKRFEGGREEFDIKTGISPVISDIAANLLLYQKEFAGWNDAASITLEHPSIDIQQFESEEFQAKLVSGQPNASWYKKVRDSIRAHFGSQRNYVRQPLFETGTIASCNSVVRDIDLFVQWLQMARGILAIEMESAGVYQATQRIQRQYPLMSIRGISDILGFERDNRWTKYACQTAAAFAYAFVTAGIVAPREDAEDIVTPKVDKKKPTSKPVVANGEGPVEVFISYSEKDEKFKEQLETHLAWLKRQKIIQPWHSGQVEAGREYEQETTHRIDSAQIILLLVSPDFMASNQLYDNEMMRAMERHESGDACVIPIILRAADLSDTPFKKLKSLPRSDKPISGGGNADEIWTGIVGDIRALCVGLRKKAPSDQ